AGHSGLLPATSATETPADEPSSEPVDPEATPDEAFTEEESLESVILRRGSTRVMRHETTPNDVLLWALACAIRPVPVDVLLPGTTLLSSWLSIHSVDG